MNKGLKKITFLGALLVTSISSSAHALHCDFCNVTSKKAPTEILYHDDLVTAFKKNRSTDHAECLIIPNQHITNLNDIDPQNPAHAKLLAHLVGVAQLLSTCLQGSDSYKIEINNGAPFQGVFHMHWHFKTHSQWAPHKLAQIHMPLKNPVILN